MNWTEIAEGVQAKVLDLSPGAVPLVVLQPAQEMTPEDMDALARAWEQVRESAANARLMVMPPGSRVEWYALGGENWVERIAARVHAAWMAEKQRQGWADHPLSAGCIVQTRCALDHTLHDDDMLPWRDLPESLKESKRATVRAVLAALIEEDSHDHD